jgi:chromosome segregation protein
MQVERLRLVGFKSFLDATELTIEPGLTGVVGPNGCGKSNLVEALRWVMGETSAKRLRGGEMDDVIFAGTADRPTRNIAEVALTIDNSTRDAPFAFNDREEIEVIRRLERGSGSIYRVNGREVRARDVQLLFADAASGAHSGAMVSQGRVAMLIDAKPAERRLLLEEAAGTAGLQARRHETELKLNATEDNLARLDDVIVTIEAQFETLKKQARQAQRYRRLAEHIRRTEALLFRARWLAAEAETERADTEFRAAERAVAEATERALAEGRARETAESALPPLRLADAAASAELQRLTHARDSLEQELHRVLAARGEAERRLAQLAADLEREDGHLSEAEAALAGLSEEQAILTQAEQESSPARARATQRLREEDARLAEAEAGLQRETEAAAIAEARRATLDQRRREFSERRARLETRRSDSKREGASLTAALVAPEAVTAAATARDEAETIVERCRALMEAGESEIADRLAREQTALDAARQIETQLLRLKAEAEGLGTLLVPPPDAVEGLLPILTELRVAAGFEAAIGAVFEDELLAPLADTEYPAAPRFWVALARAENSTALPAGAHPLSEAVTAPPALARSLAQAGWVEDEDTGRRLQSRLVPGQRLVDREGRLWRWDGFTSLRPGPSSAAEHLRHRNRLAVLEEEIAAVEEAQSIAVERAASARAEREQASDAERSARQQLRNAETALTQARTAEVELARRALTAETRLAAAAEILAKIEADLAETTAQAEESERELATLPDPSTARTALEGARAAAAEARRLETEARAEIDRLSREAAHRRERLSAIDLEERGWRKRREGAAVQRLALQERQCALQAELASLIARPAAISGETEKLAAAIADAATNCRHSADALALGETRLRQSAEGSRLAEQALAEAREHLARLEVLRDSATETLPRLAREIRERLDAAPETLAELAGLANGDAPPEALDTSTRLDRLIRERDSMGPVNLVAESEAAELETRIGSLQRERAELTEAIARLRRGISALDQEVRRRLVAAFERINGHFAELFMRLFGGGKAHLSLVDDDDPLAAGLEIMASPPGKRLQSLSLLSGGEQALTALALLFAAFLTNPAPVCVLDEVDAPLDDANVDRFCSLVGDIADMTGTRFLVVTHHRITMARVDRLFGVTMVERGVSQLVSVDLARAVRLRQSA